MHCPSGARATDLLAVMSPALNLGKLDGRCGVASAGNVCGARRGMIVAGARGARSNKERQHTPRNTPGSGRTSPQAEPNTEALSRIGRHLQQYEPLGQGVGATPHRPRSNDTSVSQTEVEVNH